MIKTFFNNLTEKGIQLYLKDGNLHFSAPKEVMTDEIKKEISLNKAEIIKYLENNNDDLNTISLVERKEYMPVSSQQQQMYFLSMLKEIKSTYNEITVLNLKGDVNSKKLEDAFNLVIKRHEALRTTYHLVNGTVLQKINDSNFKLEVLDVSDDSLKANIEDIIFERTHKVFDLRTDLLIRSSLIKCSTNEYVLVIVVHHIAFDGWSRGLLFSELSNIYNGNIDKLPKLNIQYCDYSAWANNRFESNELKEKCIKFSEDMKKASHYLNLPLDFERPNKQTYAGNTISNTLICKDGTLDQFLKTYGITKYILFFSVYSILLSKISNSTDLIIGSPFSNRGQLEVEKMIGFFVNTMPVHFNINENSSFADVITENRKKFFEMYNYQEVPLNQILSEVNPERSNSFSPLFQNMFTFQNLPCESLKLNNVEVSVRPFKNATAKMDLSLTISDSDDNYICDWEYNINIFNEITIKRFSKQFETLLKKCISSPDLKIKDLSLLSSEEENMIFNKFNNTKYDYEYKPVDALFSEIVNTYSDNIALRSNDKKLSYLELQHESDCLATHLALNGVKKGDLIGVYLERSEKLVITLLAIIKIGGVYIPLDPLYPHDRIEYIVSNSNMTYLISEKNTVDNIKDLAKNISIIDINDKTDISEPFVAAEKNENDLAYIIYTSGSTGKPKGVMISHNALTNFLISMKTKPGFNKNDIMMAITTNCFDISILELLLPIVCGGCCYVCGTAVLKDIDKLLNEMDKVSPTVMQATPATWKMLMYKNWKNDSNIRILCGGEKLTEDLRDYFIELKSEAWNMYGPTETTIWSTCKRIDSDNNSVGRPINNTYVYILNKDGKLCSIGEKGELYISGLGIAHGYYGNKELTDQRFINNPFVDGMKMYCTGDLGYYLENGEIFVEGRNDSQIKLRGFRIELGEIENVLRQSSIVKDAVVVLKNENNDNKFIAAFVILNNNNNNYAESKTVIESDLRKWLPDYMLPSAYVFLDEYPVNQNGKIDKKKLCSMELSSSSDNIAEDEEITELQSELLETVKKLLNIENIRIDDNFFDIGGNSLLIIRFLAEIEEKFNVSFTLEELMELPTIRRISNLIECSKTDSFDLYENDYWIDVENRLFEISENEIEHLDKVDEIEFNLTSEVVKKIDLVANKKISNRYLILLAVYVAMLKKHINNSLILSLAADELSTNNSVQFLPFIFENSENDVETILEILRNDYIDFSINQDCNDSIIKKLDVFSKKSFIFDYSENTSNYKLDEKDNYLFAINNDDNIKINIRSNIFKFDEAINEFAYLLNDFLDRF